MRLAQLHPLALTVSLALCSLFGSLSGGSAVAQPVVHQAQNSDPEPGPVGERPYEMAGRREERLPLVAFDDVSGWVVAGQQAEGWLYGSQDRKLYRDYCGKLVYVGRGQQPSLLVRPEKPVPIPEPWDAVSLWTWGNNWGWVPDPGTPPLHAAAVVRDAAGAEFEVPLGFIDYQYWFLMHGRLRAEESQRLKRPTELIGLRFTNGRNQEKRSIYLGPCYFYQEDTSPLTFEPWPEKLPFPTRPETILPANKIAGFKNEVRRDGAATILSYHGPDCALEYRYLPRDGTLGDIEVRHGGKAFRPCAKGGPQLAGLGAGEPARATLKEQHLGGDVLTVAWHLQGAGVAADVEYRLRIVQKSLIVDISASAPVVERIALGRAEPVREAKLFRVPFLTYGGSDPHVLYANGLFLFTQFDWYQSDASALIGRGMLGPDWAVFNGEAEYRQKTDGMRNSVRERLFITASPEFQEVLPTIPNPKSPFRELQGERLWRVRFGADYRAEIADAVRLRSYGCDKVTIRYHEETWRDAGESFTFRLDAAPAKGGDAALRRFVSAIKNLGWRVGLYTNYCDYAPVNRFWNENWVSRLPNGDWQRAWPRCYAPKPMIAVEMEAKLAPQIQAKFGENHSYCDVHTCVSPFDRVDYDARVPGAATFRRTFECFARLLHNEKSAHQGPVYSEGTNHWWYAGLTDGNYGQLNSPGPSQVPLLVDFDLLKMHPLEMDAGMGAPDMFFRDQPHNLDQYIATTLAYGHIGFLEWESLEGALKIYYMMQQAQKRYAMAPVRKIEYDDNGELVDTSRALVSGSYLKNRVHAVYENGTEVYVNGSAQPWPIKGPDHRFVLPEWGYLVWRPGDDLLAYSALVPVGGPAELRGPRRRVDLSLGTDQCYADSRGGFAFLGPIALEGSAALKRDYSSLWVIPTTKCRDFAFSPGLAKAGEAADFDVLAVAEDGRPVGPPEVRWSRGLLHILPTSDAAFTYEVRKARRARPVMMVCETTLALPGSQIQAALPPGVKASESRAFWEIGEKETTAGASAADHTLTCQVPSDPEAGQHIWLGVPTDADTLWLDFIVVDPCQAELGFDSPVHLSRGEPLRVQLNLASNLDAEAAFGVKLSASPGASCQPEALKIPLEAGGSASAEFGIALPWAEGSHQIAAAVEGAGRLVTCAMRLSAEVVHPLIADLSDPQRPFLRGFALRGRDEVIGGATVYDGAWYVAKEASGGVERSCLFAHPPWGDGRAGYVFALYDLSLPPGEPASFRFWMGIRDGYQSTDGVTYQVEVVDARGRAHQLLSQGHNAHAWKQVRVDLSAFAGQRVKLKLIADCGPSNDTNADHALWGDPRVVVDEPRLLVKRAGKERP